ncbi:MAG: hypothetical protein J7L77_05280, partial [Clostridiales bacterium]|nr:hypothetical protein [Clostridiales bacterium]
TTTVGGTPHWGRTGVFGQVMTQLIKFPLQAFSNHGIVDLKGTLLHKDPRAMGAMAMWFTGSYMAAMMRYEVQGRDYTEDDLIMAGIMGMPLFGAPYAMFKTGTDGTAMQSALGGASTNMASVMDSIGN